MVVNSKNNKEKSPIFKARTLFFLKFGIFQKNILNLSYILFYYFIINSIKGISSLNSSYTEIMITIKGNGTQQILQNNNHYYDVVGFNKVPDEIYINNMLQESSGYSVYIESENLKNNVTMKWNYLLTDCQGMFLELYNIINIYFINFDTSNVVNMKAMFYKLRDLESLDLKNFDTSKVTEMYCMFKGCNSLTTLDLSMFDTSKVNNMRDMFYECNLLTTLDLSIFDTSKVTNIGHMFYGCNSLTTLDLSRFDTSKVTNMGYMFY